MLKRRNYNEMVTYILDKIREMDISEDDKKTLFTYITSLESKYFMEMGNAQQWIPCSERLPDMGFSVLVSVENEYFPYVAEALLEMDGTWTQFRWSAKLKAEDVIAWMPLPEPWKGDEA